MSKVHCQNCGKSYVYETNGCCPECGAYNRPPQRKSILADGTVNEGTAKIFCEKEERHEATPHRSRTSSDRLKRIAKGFHPTFGKKNEKKSNTIGSLLALVISITVTLIGANRKESTVISREWDDGGNERTIYAEVGEYFTLDGEEMRICDLQIVDDTLFFTEVGADVWLEVLGYTEDGAYDELKAYSMEYLCDDPIIRANFPLNGMQSIEKLRLGSGDEEAEIDLSLMRADEAEPFDWQGGFTTVMGHELRREGPSKVLDDNILTVEVSGQFDDTVLPQLWAQSGKNICTLEPESRDGGVLRYNLHRLEPERMTLYFPGEGEAYWVALA